MRREGSEGSGPGHLLMHSACPGGSGCTFSCWRAKTAAKRVSRKRRADRRETGGSRSHSGQFSASALGDGAALSHGPSLYQLNETPTPASCTPKTVWIRGASEHTVMKSSAWAAEGLGRLLQGGSGIPPPPSSKLFRFQFGSPKCQHNRVQAFTWRCGGAVAKYNCKAMMGRHGTYPAESPSGTFLHLAHHHILLTSTGNNCPTTQG